MTPAELIVTLGQVDVLALTMWAEARGDRREGHSSLEERVAVGCVVRNRLRRPKSFRALEPSWRGVCLAPSQFSCWAPLEGAENYRALLALVTSVVDGRAHDALYAETLYLAHGIVNDVIQDLTRGATHYYAPKSMNPPGRVPSWAQHKPAVQVGDQMFLVA